MYFVPLFKTTHKEKSFLIFFSQTDSPLKPIWKWLFSSLVCAAAVVWKYKERKSSYNKYMSWTFSHSQDDWSQVVKVIFFRLFSFNLRVMLSFRCQEECEYWGWPHFQMKGKKKAANYQCWTKHFLVIIKFSWKCLFFIERYSRDTWARFF